VNVYFTQLTAQKIRAHVFFILNRLQYWYLSIVAQETSKHIFPLLSMKNPICGLKSIITDLDLTKLALCSIRAVYFSYTVSFSGLHKGSMMDTTLTLNHLGFSVIMYCICFWMLRWACILLSSHVTMAVTWPFAPCDCTLHWSIVCCLS